MTEMLTPDDVASRVEAIREFTWDSETAHQMEDQIHRDVLRAISESRCSNATACAAEALKTRDIQFDRWYA